MALQVTTGSNESLVSSNLGITTGSFSHGFWYQPIGLAGTNTLTRQRGDVNGFTIRTTSAGANFQWTRERTGIADDNVTESFTVVVGTWYHLAMTYDGTNVVAYRNGVRIGSVASSGTGNSAGNSFRVGTHDGSANVANARFAHVFVFNSVLSANQIKQIYLSRPSNVDGNLRLYWPLNEGAGTTTYDHGLGQGTNNGTITTANWSNLHPPTTYK